jgi:hypothetical protein
MASKRKNISLETEVLKTAKALWKERHERGLSMLISNLIKEEDRRRQSAGVQSSAAPRKPFGERVAETVETLMEDFVGYMARCKHGDPKAGSKSAMFESWALQRLAALVVRGVELEERITGIEDSSRR